MGNCCSSSKNETDPFAQPGRPLGANQQPAKGTTSTPSGPRAPLPKASNWGSAGRTLGGPAEPASAPDTADARSNAAVAAQKRAESASGAHKGKLGSKLAAQKAQTQNQTLNEASRSERDTRAALEVKKAQQWD
ncbi:hypothetical protein FE257_010090 [Aspergillus nanangensis]|uniref:Uncharacterized protein n=1 Tax=Aspergillus nanangensis TaxID=2582783 RepID=A0AAD4CJN0_ASPNN|nr:hypothetical protein FE257_010090 [Aspergillus nanangensis]